MDSLNANPSAGIYNQPSQGSGQDDVLGIVNQLKDREMRDFQNKANFMSDLSLKQDRIKALFNPQDPNNISGAFNPNAPSPGGLGEPGIRQQNVVMGQDPNQITGAQKAELGMRQQGLNLEGQKIAQTGKLGEERVGIQKSQEALNQQKSDQIHQQKQNELAEKTNEANRKLSQAQAKLEAAQGNAEASLAAHKEMNAAMEERHKLEMAQAQHKMDQQDDQFKVLQKQHDEVIKQHENEHKVQTDSQGNQITTDTTRGNAATDSDPLGIR